MNELSGWVYAAFVGIFIFMVGTVALDSRQTDQIDRLETDIVQLQDDRVVLQRQVNQLRSDVERYRATTSASVTDTGGCTLHDIYTQQNGC